jgi:hypothetical protein
MIRTKTVHITYIHQNRCFRLFRIVLKQDWAESFHKIMNIVRSKSRMEKIVTQSIYVGVDFKIQLPLKSNWLNFQF